MKIILDSEKREYSREKSVIIRIFALNDTYDPVVLDRRLLIGPNPVTNPAIEPPFPLSVEPAFQHETQNLVTLNPWCFYGRQRSFENFPRGTVTFYGYLLRSSQTPLLPDKPKNLNSLAASADPLAIKIS
jgi:hypothetical protein